MKKGKKLVCIIVGLLMCLSFMASCSKDDGAATDGGNVSADVSGSAGASPETSASANSSEPAGTSNDPALQALLDWICADAYGDGQWPEELVIGHVQGLTGMAATNGQPQAYLIMHLVDEINKAGGIGGHTQIRYVGYDTAANATDAVAAYIRMAENDNVSFIIGSSVSNESVACAAFAHQYQIPTFWAAVDETIMTLADGSRNYYNYIDQPSGTQHGSTAAEVMCGREGYKKIALIYNEENAYCSSIAFGFQDYVEAKYPGVSIEMLTCRTADTDYSVQIQRATAAGCDAIYISLYTSANADVVKQTRERGVSLPIYGTTSLHPNVTPAGRVAEDEVYYFLTLDTAAEELTYWRNWMLDNYNCDVSVQAYASADGFLTAIGAFMQCRSTDGAEINKYITGQSIAGFQSSEYSLSADTHLPIGLVMYEARYLDVDNLIEEILSIVEIP